MACITTARDSGYSLASYLAASILLYSSLVCIVQMPFLPCAKTWVCRCTSTIR